MIFDLDFFHKELLKRKSEDYDRYKDFNEGDLAIEMVLQKYLTIKDVDWTLFYPLYLIVERTENPPVERCTGVQIESFAKRFYGSDRLTLLEQFRDNAKHYIPKNFQNTVLSEFENESSRLLFECKNIDDYKEDDTFDILREILQKPVNFYGLTREEWTRIDMMINEVQGQNLKFSMLKSENESLNKRIKELEAQPQSHGLTVDQICDYAKEFLERNERQIISHMLLNIIENPDKETKAKIKSLDKKTPLDAQKVVLGDEVQTKIVKS